MGLTTLFELAWNAVRGKPQSVQATKAVSSRTDAFVKEITERYGSFVSPQPHRAYVSGILLLDMLTKTFEEAHAAVPSPVAALDIGVGDWHYVRALHQFLHVASGGKDVQLTGIDYHPNHARTIKSLIHGLQDVTFKVQDFFAMDVAPAYDIVFAMHPLATKEVYAAWDIPFRPLPEFWARARAMLKPGGLLFGCGYLYNGGASAFNSFPQQGVIVRTHYLSPVAHIQGVNVIGIKGFDENVVMLARKMDSP